FAMQWDVGGRRLLQALHCWIWPNMLFWTVIPEHATRHSFPLFPGLAGLAAFICIAWLRGLQSQSISLGAKIATPADCHRGALHDKYHRDSIFIAGRAFIGLLIVWLIVKLVFIEVVLPRRNPLRQPKEKGEHLAALVPRDEVLYLFRLKDEGIMFYYG